MKDAWPPLGEPPDCFGEAQRAAWNDIIRAAPPVFHNTDSTFLSVLAPLLALWRKGDREAWMTRQLYRMLGDCFVPMRERRRLLFPAPADISQNSGAGIGRSFP